MGASTPEEGSSSSFSAACSMNGVETFLSVAAPGCVDGMGPLAAPRGQRINQHITRCNNMPGFTNGQTTSNRRQTKRTPSDANGTQRMLGNERNHTWPPPIREPSGPLDCHVCASGETRFGSNSKCGPKLGSQMLMCGDFGLNTRFVFDEVLPW